MSADMAGGLGEKMGDRAAALWCDGDRLKSLKDPRLKNRNESRTVLIIAYYYPPCTESGSLRPAGLAKCLARFGWEPLVLTPRLPGRQSPNGIIETDNEDILGRWKRLLRLDPHRGLHQQLNLPLSSQPNSRLWYTKIIDGLKDLITYPDPHNGWVRHALNSLNELKKTREVHAIISTAPPITAHIVGKHAKAIFGCPWIADYRDLWSVGNSSVADRGDWLCPINARYERRLLRSADALVTVSEPWAEDLRQRYAGHPVTAITNGFDPDDLAPNGCELTKKFSITYAGMLYQGRRDPTMLFEVLHELIEEGAIRRNDLQVRFYGRVEPFLSALVKRFDFEDVVELRGSVARKEVLDAQRESQLLLLLSWSDPLESGLHTGKVFEYLASKRPIIAIGGGRGVLTDLLVDTKAGEHVFSKQELREYLLKAYKDYRQNGRVSYQPNIAEVNKYSHVEMVRSFTEVLGSVTATPAESLLGADLAESC